ncbi:hypothetical protein OQA88_2883 [Cercophora sp. LCS_1]
MKSVLRLVGAAALLFSHIAVAAPVAQGETDVIDITTEYPDPDSNGINPQVSSVKQPSCPRNSPSDTELFHWCTNPARKPFCDGSILKVENDPTGRCADCQCK